MCEARYLSIGHLLKSNPNKCFKVSDIMNLNMYGVTPASIRRELVSLCREGYVVHVLTQNGFRWAK